MSLIQRIYGSLFVNNNITGGTLTLSSITKDNSLTQILVRDNFGSVGYRDVDSITSGITIQDTFVTGFTFNNSTYDLTIKQNEGQSDLVTNLASLATDVYVVSGIYNPSNGVVTYTNTSGGTFEVSGFTTGMTDSYTTDVYLSGTELRFDNNIQGVNFYNVDLLPLLSGKTDVITFNTYTANTKTILDGKIDSVNNLGGANELFKNKSGTTLNFRTLSGGSNTTVSTVGDLVKIDVSLPPSMNTYVTGGTYNDTTDIITLTRNDGVTIDITGVTDNFVIAGSYSDSTDTISLLRQDGSFVNITGVTDTFTTGATYDNGTALATFNRNDGNSYTLDLSTIDVNDTFVTGFTYNDNNTFTITRNDGVDITSSINTVSALTVTNYIDYTTGTKPSAISGRTYFDRDENALSYFPETLANDVTINIGQESVIRVHNNTGVQINNGEVCHISSDLPSVNGVPSVVLAIATGSTTTGSRYLVSGVATHNIPNGTEGFITSFGLVRDLNITGVTEGTEIFLSETTPGAFRYAAPDTEFRRSVVGYVATTGATTGKILVEISNEVGFSELSESLLSVLTENNASTGTRDGGEITINGGDNTLFDISSGSGIIVDNYTDANNPTITNVVWGNITGNTVTNLTADTGSYIFLNSSLNTVQFGITNPPTEADFRDNIFLGIVGHSNFTNLINVFNTPTQIVSPINQHQDLTSAIGPFSIVGNRILNIPGTLELEKTAGRSFFYGGNFHTDNKVPSNITTSDLSGSTLIYATGANVLGPSGTTIDPNNYDPDGGGTITAIPGTNAYVAHRIWHQPSSNLLIFQYGQDFYTNAAEARDEFEFENFVVPAGLNETSYLVAVIIAQDGDTDLDSANIIPQGKFAGTGGGGGSAADTLQTAYDNSSTPEIVTDATRGAVDFRVGSGSDSDNVVTFQQNSGTINAFVEGTGDAKFTNLTGTSVTSNSAINVFNGHINIRDNSYFLQGRTVADVNVSLIGVDNQDRVFVGNAGYDTYIDSDTIVDGVLSAQTAFLTTTPTLNNSATDILVRNGSTGEVEYRPVSGITPDTNTFVTGSTVTSNVLELTRNDSQQVLQLSGGTNVQFVDNGNNSITLNATSGGGGGASVSFPWKFKDPTASADPGSGQFRLNNTIPSGITEIYVSDETNNSIDASNLLNILDVGDVIYIQQNDDASRALLFTVSASTVDNTGWFTIPVQYQQGSTIPKKDKICGWIFASTGAEDNTVSNVGVGQGVFKQKNVNDFEFYSLSGGSNTTLTLNNDTIVIDVTTPPDTDTFVSGGTYNDTTNNINFSGNSAETTFDVDLTSLVSSVSANTFVISGTYVDSTDTLALLRNDGNFVNVTGITDTFVTGTTFSSNQATVTRNDGTEVLLLTGDTNVTLSNPSTNQIKIGLDLGIKSGTVRGTEFSGNPKTYKVIFTNAYSNDEYSINITGEDSRNYTYQNKTSSSFVINTNSNTSFTNQVDWVTIKYGEQ